MLRTRMKRLVDRSDHAIRQLAEIEAATRNPADEDLLDLADISEAENCTLLADLAFAEMARRNISL